MRRLLTIACSTTLLAAIAAPAAAASWQPSTLITRSADPQFDFSVGTDGTAAAVWSRDGYVRAAVKRRGAGWGSAVRVSDGRFGVGRAAVAVTGRGEVVVAWVQNGRRAGRPGPVIGPLTIRSRTRGVSGGWGSERVLGTTAHFVEAGIDLAANAGGEAIAVWRGVRRTSATRRTDAVQSAFRRPSTAFGGAQTVRDQAGRRSGVTGPLVVLDERGTAHVAWSDALDEVVRLASRSRGARGAWLTPRTIGGKPSSNPVIAIGGDRSVTIAWRAAQLDSEGDGIQSGALDVRARNTSGALTDTQRVSQTATHNYRLATGPLGQAVLTWSGRDTDPPTPGVADLRVATRATASGRFGVPEIVTGVKPDDFHGGPVMLPDETVLFAWSDAGRTRVVARPPGGSFATTPEFDEPGLYPLLAAAGAGALMAFNRVSGGDVGLAGTSRR